MNRIAPGSQKMRYAIVLGGGRSARMRTNKMEVQVGGHSLLQRTVTAALAWAEEVVVAAPRPDTWTDDPQVSFTLEDPPFGGPVAGINAAVARLSDADDRDQVLLLAGDLARPNLVVAALKAGAVALEPNEKQDLGHPGQRSVAGGGASAGVILEDSGGWAQYLAGIYVLGALRTALQRVEGVRNLSVRRLLRDLPVLKVSAGAEVTADLDTPEDLRGTFGPQAC